MVYNHSIPGEPPVQPWQALILEFRFRTLSALNLTTRSISFLMVVLWFLDCNPLKRPSNMHRRLSKQLHSISHRSLCKATCQGSLCSRHILSRPLGPYIQRPKKSQSLPNLVVLLYHPMKRTSPEPRTWVLLAMLTFSLVLLSRIVLSAGASATALRPHSQCLSHIFLYNWARDPMANTRTLI